MSDRTVWVDCQECGAECEVSSSLQGPRPECVHCGAVLVVVPTPGECRRVLEANRARGRIGASARPPGLWVRCRQLMRWLGGYGS